MVMSETGASLACVWVYNDQHPGTAGLQSDGPGALRLPVSIADEEPWGGIEGTTSSDFDPKDISFSDSKPTHYPRPRR
jgi:hypothetical protein